MDLRSGKTFRRCLQHNQQDCLLEVNMEKDSISLFGHEFQNNVQYSMKKKYRYELRSKLCKDGYDGDRPLLYNKHQSLTDCRLVTGVYLYDSLTEKEIGSASVSDRHLKGGGFNVKSAICQLENRFNYTDREKKSFEKSLFKQRKSKKQSRKSHRPMPVIIPESTEHLPERAEYEADKAKRLNCVFVTEYVHLNDISAVNRIPALHGIRRQMSSGDIATMKRNEKELLVTISSERENSEDEFEQLSDSEETRRPFVLTKDDLVCISNRTAPKKRQKKRRYSPKMYLNLNDKHQEYVETEVEANTTVIDLHEDLLPCVAIESTVADFIEDARAIMDFCPCRISGYPPTISVDLDEFVDLSKKSFLLIRPIMWLEGNMVTVKVILNIGDRGPDYNEIIDQNFDSVKCLVAFVQSRLQQVALIRYSTSRKLITLDGKIDGITNLWKTKEADSCTPLYLQHKEWSTHKLNEENLRRIFDIIPLDPGECTVCFSDVTIHDMVMIRPCGHIICDKCISSHVVFRLESGMQKMICPGSDCDILLDATIILSLVSWRRYSKRLAILESGVISQGGCPCSFCGAVLMNILDPTNERRKRVEYKCHCGNHVCSRCGQKRHFPSTCNEMRKHKMKMSQLKDVQIMPVKVKPLILSGRSCPKCFTFVIKNGGCNHLSCNCGAHFCWGCGDSMGVGLHLTVSFPCNRVSELVTYDLTQHSLTPDPSSLRPRLYCTALYHQIINNNYETMKFYERFQAILSLNLSQSDTKHILDQVSDLSTVIESIFVKAYQINKRTQINTLRYIKSSVSLFLFYQTRIKAIVDGTVTNTKACKRNNCGKRVLKETSEKLSILAGEIQCHLNRFSKVISDV